MVCIKAPSSKSMLHRMIIAAALSGSGVAFDDPQSKDVEATISCMAALLSSEKISEGIEKEKNPYGTAKIDKPIDLYCGESGSTLRFILPLVGAFGKSCVFHMEGRLPDRPLFPYDDELRAHGMRIEKSGTDLLVSGQLNSGEFKLPGNISSQYITGLLFALPLLDGESRIIIENKLESSAYVDMTLDVLEQAGITVEYCIENDKCEVTSFRVSGNQKYRLDGIGDIEGDYSSAAFFLCLGALRNDGVRVIGLNHHSRQGDRAVIYILKEFGADVIEIEGGYEVRKNTLKGIRIDASQIPDIIPILSVVAAFAEGRTEIVNGIRLRYKESDRIKSTVALLKSIGANARELEDGLIIEGADHLPGGCVDSQGDHRIAMSAGIASLLCDGSVEINNRECVDKSYPDFWRDLDECL